MTQKPADALSIITPCYNDIASFQETLTTLQNELREEDQLIVIDSSSNKDRVPALLAQARMNCDITTKWLAPSGVYGALNAGIELAQRPWLQVVNSGDGLMPGARSALTRALREAPDAGIHVFRQLAGQPDENPYVFTPDARSVWPHQSVVLKRQIHKTIGLYDVRLRLTADQVFLAHARRTFPWVAHDFVLTRYDLHGLSSAVSWQASMELWLMWRSLGRSPIEACWRAWINPRLRLLTERLLGHRGMVALKKSLNQRYSAPES